jgi:plastocyanin
VSIRPRIVVSVALVLVTVLVLGTVASAATYRVRAKFASGDYRWRPKTLEVPTGSRVVWRIVDGRHNVTSIGSNWSKSTGTLRAGDSTSHRFNDGGTYRYRCTLHSTLNDGMCSGMCGRVLVG